MSRTFIYEDDRSKAVLEMKSDSTLEEMLTFFENYLKVSGFNIDGANLDIIYDKN